MKLKKGIPVIDQGDRLGFWGGKFGGNFVPETLKKPIEDLEIQFNKLKNDKNFIRERDKYFKNWIGTPTRFIKLNNLTKHVGGAQIWSKVVSDANGGAHKIYNATVHCLLAKRSGKKVIIGDTGAGYAGKMLSMAAKKFGLKCKIFMGAKDIKRQRPNVEAMKKNVSPLAVVGVPCQVDGVRQQQHSSIRLDVANWYRDNISLVIGLFCSESFSEQGIDWLAEECEVPKKDILNINIKGRIEIKLRDGREEVRSLKKMGKYARPACLYCMDYSADNADIGFGGIGLDKWTYTVIRTEAGHKAWQALVDDGWVETKEWEEFPKGKEIVERLSIYKRNRPLPALMPNLEERKAIGNLDPKNYYRGWEDGKSAKDWRPLPPPPPKKKKVTKKEGEGK